jgi:hypothetical protein
VTVATAEAFRERSGAIRVVLLLDQDGEAVLVESTPDSLTVTHKDETTDATPNTQPITLHRLTPVPASAISLDAETGELSAPLGTIEHLAKATLDLASAFGGRTVATAEFATRDPELPITFAAREGEPVILAAGDEQFEL